MTEDTGFVADDAPAVVDWKRIQRLRQATATERPLPPLPQYQCGNCGETFGTNCDPGDISCPECEAHLCPHCGKWFGGDCDEDEDEVFPGPGPTSERVITEMVGVSQEDLRLTLEHVTSGAVSPVHREAIDRVRAAAGEQDA